MTQLTISDLEFCEPTTIAQKQIKGEASFFAFDFDFDFDSKFNLAGAAAAGFAAGVGIAIGDNSFTIVLSNVN
ncbi:hypothetical protein FRE64_04990 [Euhalothece natronophila Z-M001]|uniref:Uncharacterized protein n=1 Tax=Euhalothece natronophila Z-M001 TaxID=522448 RepID=A0A5B8NK71_9CHRO|nr:hypothetical protein [Euhalothece natronophila]QDZ39338.1 hypothetical protein FRE64_04990 [Euhalothece natronophila Z-M001]